MIYSFSCKNFYSFKGLATLNFGVNEKAPNNYGYFTTPSENRLSKIETVIGANASGKTNLLKVLPFLKWFIIDSFGLNPAADIAVKPFMFGESKNEPSELSVDFEIEGDIYTYSFVLTNKKILSEELKIRNKSEQKVTSKKVFSRQWNNEQNKYELDDKNFNLPKEFEKLLRNNCTVISSAIRLNHKESQKIAQYWQKIESNVMEHGWIGDHLMPNAIGMLVDTLDFYSESKNETLKKAAETLLSKFDLGLNSFDIKKEKTNDGALNINVKVGHSFGDKIEYLPMQYESAGTKQLFILLKTILLVLNNGGFAVLDEFDVNLHPEMIVALFDLFMQPETNPKNAQILFSTHSHQILNKLDKYQIIFTEKNNKGESEIWRLDDISGVRADDNYYTKYIAGAYGAVPKIM